MSPTRNDERTDDRSKPLGAIIAIVGVIILIVVVAGFFLLGGEADVDVDLDSGELDVEAPDADVDVNPPDVEGEAPDVDVDPGSVDGEDAPPADAEAD